MMLQESGDLLITNINVSSFPNFVSNCNCSNSPVPSGKGFPTPSSFMADERRSSTQKASRNSAQFSTPQPVTPQQPSTSRTAVTGKGLLYATEA